MSEENPVLPVRLWRRLEDGTPWALPVTRAYFRLYYSVRYPVRTFYDLRKWHQRPKIGDQVQDCRHEIHTVTGFVGGDEDTLLLDDGHSASWMNCCDPVKKERKKWHSGRRRK